MAGYSGTPLPKKLGIRDGHRVVLFDAPEGFEAALEPLPDGVLLERDAKSKAPFDVAVLFATSRKALEKGFARAAKKLHSNGGLWLAWPKKSSGVETDVTESAISDRTRVGHGRQQGLRDRRDVVRIALRRTSRRSKKAVIVVGIGSWGALAPAASLRELLPPPASGGLAALGFRITA
jgi:hypothetical protein